MVRMPEQVRSSGWSPSTRGESAWTEERERVAARNAEARKAGKAAREAYERGRDERRRAAAKRRSG
jgi:hypothetical protein